MADKEYVVVRTHTQRYPVWASSPTVAVAKALGGKDRPFKSIQIQVYEIVERSTGRDYVEVPADA